MANAVSHPSHYNVGSIEVIDAINEWQLDFDLGNVVKYVARAYHKDASKTIEDLEKARFYLEDEIKRLRGQQAIEKLANVQKGGNTDEEPQEAQ